MSGPSRDVDVHRVALGAATADADRAATEEPLEIRLHGVPFVVIMRTPGADRELAAGFLFAEGVVASRADLRSIEPCAYADADDADNIVNAMLEGGAAARVPELLAGRRRVLTTSACGVCGRRTIESLRGAVAPVTSAWTMSVSAVLGLPARIRAEQEAFNCTGGLHAAALFTPEGELDCAAEDVGRHNAVDKVIGGRLLHDTLPIDARALFVTGRTSFEIVQKAAAAGIPFVASVSAPSTLAIDLAAAAGITLVGFVRDAGFNVYTHPQRLSHALFELADSRG
jgi:FdhD protein